jgi:hypothetical protein
LHGAVVDVVGIVVVVVSVSGVEVDDESTNVVDVSLVSEVSLVGGSEDESVGASVDDDDGSTESSLATTPCE